MTQETAPETSPPGSQETRTFQAEVSRLLDIVAHSLYSQKEIFLRELISNASDACDRLRYAALTEPSLTEGDTGFRVVITPVKSSRTLTITDNGIGMNRDELIENLGTIARSGTAAFMQDASEELQRLVHGLLVPQPLQYFTETVKPVDPAALGVPASYVISTDDLALPPGEFGWTPRFPQRLGAVPVIETPGSHEANFTRPAELAAALLKA